MTLIPRQHEPDDELWMLLDTDHYTQGTHLASFVQALAEAMRQGVNVALSKPCFELWLLLHHLDGAALGTLPAARDVEERLPSVLGEYNKTNLKRAHYPHASVYDACVRAERLDRTVEGGDIPRENTSRVYLLWRSIVTKALPQQLPPDLRALRELVVGP